MKQGLWFGELGWEEHSWTRVQLGKRHTQGNGRRRPMDLESDFGGGERHRWFGGHGFQTKSPSSLQFPIHVSRLGCHIAPLGSANGTQLCP